jgi:ABC-type polysaccharide/polyol phosphate export permease
MVQREIPDLSGFAAVAALALTLLWLGAVVFRRHADEMVDEL